MCTLRVGTVSVYSLWSVLREVHLHMVSKPCEMCTLLVGTVSVYSLWYVLREVHLHMVSKPC